MGAGRKKNYVKKNIAKNCKKCPRILAAAPKKIIHVQPESEKKFMLQKIAQSPLLGSRHPPLYYTHIANYRRSGPTLT